MNDSNRCPWGKIECRQNFAPGIDFVSTPSHGGFLISDERLAEMPAKYRATAFLKSHPHAFEEDSSWVGVVLTWPQYFTETSVANARDLYERAYAHRNA